MRLEITPELVIHLYREGEDFPFFEQPYYPDQTPWADKADCTEWAGAYMNHLLDPEIYPQPPLSPAGWDEYRAALPQE
jgi:hypothetical protein